MGWRRSWSLPEKYASDFSVCTNNSTGHPPYTSDFRIGAGGPSSSTVMSRSDVGDASPRTTLPAEPRRPSTRKLFLHKPPRNIHRTHPPSLPPNQRKRSR